MYTLLARNAWALTPLGLPQMSVPPPVADIIGTRMRSLADTSFWVVLLSGAAALPACQGVMDSPGGGGSDGHPADAGAQGEGPHLVDDDADWRPDVDGAGEASVEPLGPEGIVAALQFERFTGAIQRLSDFGDRFVGSGRYEQAEAWLRGELEAAGYDVQGHGFHYDRESVSSLHVTKVGAERPDQMYIVSAHLDGTGGGGAADDDGSGVALVLEAARAFSSADVTLDRSVRFIFWNAEETGLDGSRAYVADRASLQGIEEPPGSGAYPEPTWLGVIQHDMILFDHGLPPGGEQSPAADIDVEYQASSTRAADSRALAEALVAGGDRHGARYPAEVGWQMSNTDSAAFQDHAPAVSVRENRRLDEIGSGSNPHWHQRSDVFETYSEADFRLGFDALEMTVGTVAELAGATVTR